MTFQNVRQWLQEIERYAADNVVKLLIGNKCDMEDDRAVTFEQGQELADSLGVSFMEASAKRAMNVEELFNKIATDILKIQAAAATPKQEPTQQADLNKKPEPAKKKGCSLM